MFLFLLNSFKMKKNSLTPSWITGKASIASFPCGFNPHNHYVIAVVSRKPTHHKHFRWFQNTNFCARFSHRSPAMPSPPMLNHLCMSSRPANLDNHQDLCLGRLFTIALMFSASKRKAITLQSWWTRLCIRNAWIFTATRSSVGCSFRREKSHGSSDIKEKLQSI